MKTHVKVQREHRQVYVFPLLLLLPQELFYKQNPKIISAT